MSRSTPIRLPLAMLVACGFATPATAGVIEWGYSITSQFTAATSSGSGSGFVFAPTQISWGDPSGSTSLGGRRSSIAIDDSPSTGSVFTNGEAGLANSYLHTNNIIKKEFPVLATASLDLTVLLSALDSAGGDVTLTLPFTVNFVETDNDPDSGICADGSAVGSSGSGCADIFALSFGSLSETFEFEGERYEFSLFAPGGAFGPLSDDACSAAGVSPGCAGFLTSERVVNAVRFGFIITQIPEPGVPGLFGLGLMGIGLARRGAHRD